MLAKTSFAVKCIWHANNKHTDLIEVRDGGGKKRGGGCDIYVKGWWDRPDAENRAPHEHNQYKRSAVFHWCWWGIHNLNSKT